MGEMSENNDVKKNDDELLDDDDDKEEAKFWENFVFFKFNEHLILLHQKRSRQGVIWYQT